MRVAEGLGEDLGEGLGEGLVRRVKRLVRVTWSDLVPPRLFKKSARLVPPRPLTKTFTG